MVPGCPPTSWAQLEASCPTGPSSSFKAVRWQVTFPCGALLFLGSDVGTSTNKPFQLGINSCFSRRCWLLHNVSH